MYFIPRNNKLYQYIAHTSMKNRYVCTGFFIVAVLGISHYFFQRLITVYQSVCTQEVALLKNQYQNMLYLEEENKKLLQTIDEAKHEIQKSSITTIPQDYFKKQLFFVLEVIKQCGLKLNSYGVQKEKNYEWNIKEKAHFDITGSLKQIMEFFEIIKNAQKMIGVNQWSLVRLDNEMFHMQCDVEFVCIK